VTAPVPNADRLPPNWGGPLTEQDYAALLTSWITKEIADLAMLRRVDSQEGREVVAQKGKADCAGILIPYYWPGDSRPCCYRLRRAHPDMVQGIDGALKPTRKYLAAPGGGNHLYIPPGVTLEQLADLKIPIAIVEGEKKALAMWRLANHEMNQPRFIPVAIPGVWNWRGTIGKTGGPKGERLDVKGPIADLSRIEWTGRTVFIIFDANVHTNESVKWARAGVAKELAKRGAEVKLVTLPEDCSVNGIDDLLAAWGPARVLELIDGASDGARLHIVPSVQFESRPDGMYRIAQQGDQLRRTMLTNYRAAIRASVILDDGVDGRREFEIASELMGRPHTFTVAAAEFAKMDWPIEKMGPAAITLPNQHQYARTAIQSSSLMAAERIVYTHTGWREIDGQWVFLHAGGAIAASGEMPGTDVRMGGALNRYQLQVPKTDALAHAVRASLRLASIVPPTIGFPLLAATYRSVFGEADFAVHLAGETGAFKSALAALFQQHFGPEMNRLNLPAAWASTGNSLEALAFQAKDVLLVIDDFAPQGNAGEVSRYHASADRVFRAAGNHAGRGRLDSTARLREAKPPRALILSTGEDIPKGHSVRARLLVLELAKGSIETRNLTTCQAEAHSGLYAQAMSGFIQWFAREHEKIRAVFDRRIAELRLEALTDADHARTPDIVANLQGAFECFLEFAVSCGAVGPSERERFARESWDALRKAAAAQTKHQAATEPTARFLEMLRASISSGRAHLQSRDGSVPDRSPDACGWRLAASGWVPQGDCIGWANREAIYLEPTASFRAVQNMGREVGDQLAVTVQTLKKRLHEKGLLASTDEKRQTLTIRRSIAGCSKDVLHILRPNVLPESHVQDSEDLE